MSSDAKAGSLRILENSMKPSNDHNTETLLQRIEADRVSLEVLAVSEVRYRRLFESARDGILILDAGTSLIIDSNPFMTELLGYTREEFCGKELADIGVFKDKAQAKDAMERLQRDSFVRYDYLPLEAKTGELREVEFVCNVYVEDDQKVIQCNIRDISDRKRLEENLRQNAEDLLTALDRMQSMFGNNAPATPEKGTNLNVNPAVPTAKPDNTKIDTGKK